ncbi:MAG: protein kinase [Phycisphaerales bacterium]
MDARTVSLHGTDDARSSAGTGATDRLGSSAGANPVPNNPGSIPGFTLHEAIGGGGSGVVLAAEQHRPRRRVAIKLLHRRVGDPVARARFEAEADLLARVDHPAIARVFAAGVLAADEEGPERPWIAMELVEDGRPLTRFAQSAGLDRAARVQLIEDACAAVHHAHQRGVIHRDLKPANMLVDHEGRLRIIDFGIAVDEDGRQPTGGGHDVSVADASRGDGHDTDTDTDNDTGNSDGNTSNNTSPSHTTTVGLIGTPVYMSPEQFAGGRDAVDIRTDVYALGVVLFELIAGRVPHQVDDGPAGALLAQKQSAASSPAAFDPTVDRDLDAVIRTALAPDREDRYSTVDALADDLERWRNGVFVDARTPARNERVQRFVRRHRGAVALAGTALVLLVGGAAMMTGLWLRSSRALDDLAASQRAEQEQRERNDAIEQELEELQTALSGGLPTTPATGAVDEDITAWPMMIAADIERARPSAFARGAARTPNNNPGTGVGAGAGAGADTNPGRGSRFDPDRRPERRADRGPGRRDDGAAARGVRQPMIALADEVVNEITDRLTDTESSLERRALIGDATERIAELEARIGDAVTSNPQLGLMLAGTYRKLGDLQGIEWTAGSEDVAPSVPAYRRAADIVSALRERRPEDPRLARASAATGIDLAQALRKIGEFEEAERVASQAVEAAERLLETGDPKLAEGRLLVESLWAETDAVIELSRDEQGLASSLEALDRSRDLRGLFRDRPDTLSAVTWSALRAGIWTARTKQDGERAREIFDEGMEAALRWVDVEPTNPEATAAFAAILGSEHRIEFFQDDAERTRHALERRLANLQTWYASPAPEPRGRGAGSAPQRADQRRLAHQQMALSLLEVVRNGGVSGFNPIQDLGDAGNDSPALNAADRALAIAIAEAMIDVADDAERVRPAEYLVTRQAAELMRGIDDDLAEELLEGP